MILFLLFHCSQQELLTILLHDNFMTVPEARHLIRILVDKYDNDGDGKFNYAGRDL